DLRADEAPRGEALVERRASLELPAGHRRELVLADEDPVAEVVGEQHVAADLAEAEGDEVGRRLRRVGEGDHRAAPSALAEAEPRSVAPRFSMVVPSA